MCHCLSSIRKLSAENATARLLLRPLLVGVSIDLDAIDANRGVGLAVPLQLLVLLLALEMEDQILSPRPSLTTVPSTFADWGLTIGADPSEKARTSLNSTALSISAVTFSIFRHVAGCDAILLTTCADHRVHKTSRSRFTISLPHKDREVWFSLRENHQNTCCFGSPLL